MTETKGNAKKEIYLGLDIKTLKVENTTGRISEVNLLEEQE